MRFLGFLGVLLEAMLAHLGAMLDYVGPAGRHLGATWRHDEVQEPVSYTHLTLPTISRV